MHASELFERLATGQVALLLDVRQPEEYGTGHVAGARNVPLDDLSGAVRGGELEEWRHRPVAVVCGSGKRSAQVGSFCAPCSRHCWHDRTEWP